jgi:hypothetical protein
VAREGVEKRLDYLSRMPRMYAVSDDERFPGCRSFWVDPCYRVFYMVAAGADDVYVTAVVAEDIDGTADENICAATLGPKPDSASHSPRFRGSPIRLLSPAPSFSAVRSLQNDKLAPGS